MSLIKVVRRRQRHFSMLPPKRKTRCAIRAAFVIPKISCKEGKREKIKKSQWSWRRRYFELKLARALWALGRAGIPALTVELGPL